MPAMPAWPAQSAPRLFIDADLAGCAEIVVDGNAAHYLVHVLRLKPGAPVLLFDDRSGEWLARIAHVGKRDAVLMREGQTRPREAVPDLWLCAAPVKKDRWDYLIEKACELGVGQIVPVLTQRSVIDRVNVDRMRRIAIEAAEQCHRTALPALATPQKLNALLRAWPAGRRLYFADECGGEDFAALLARAPAGAAAAILIGPEGGFADAERQAIRAHADAVPISLGPRILRAETAALAAVAIWMAHEGDWADRSHS